MLASPRGFATSIYTPPESLDQLFPPINPGTPAYVKVEVVLMVLNRTSKAFLVCPIGRTELQRWVPASRVTAAIMMADGRALPWGCNRLSFPVWLYQNVRAEFLAAAKVTPPPTILHPAPTRL